MASDCPTCGEPRARHWNDGTGFDEWWCDNCRVATPIAAVQEVHTCHAECPCQTGGEPRPDFLPIERSLLPGLTAMYLHSNRSISRRQLQVRHDLEREAMEARHRKEIEDFEREGSDDVG